MPWETFEHLVHEKTISFSFDPILSAELNDRGLLGIHIWVEQDLDSEVELVLLFLVPEKIGFPKYLINYRFNFGRG